MGGYRQEHFFVWGIYPNPAGMYTAGKQHTRIQIQIQEKYFHRDSTLKQEINSIDEQHCSQKIQNPMKEKCKFFPCRGTILRKCRKDASICRKNTVPERRKAVRQPSGISISAGSDRNIFLYALKKI